MLDSLKQKKNSQRIKMRIKTGDLVKVINGKEKGKTAELLKTIPLETFVSTDSKFHFHTYLCVVKEEFLPKLNDEHDGYAWVSFGKWPKPLHMGLRNTLQNKTNQTKLQTVFDLIGYLENEKT